MQFNGHTHFFVLIGLKYHIWLVKCLVIAYSHLHCNNTKSGLIWHHRFSKPTPPRLKDFSFMVYLHLQVKMTCGIYWSSNVLWCKVQIQSSSVVYSSVKIKCSSLRCVFHSRKLQISTVCNRKLQFSMVK